MGVTEIPFHPSRAGWVPTSDMVDSMRSYALWSQVNYGWFEYGESPIFFPDQAYLAATLMCPSTSVKFAETILGHGLPEFELDECEDDRMSCRHSSVVVLPETHAAGCGHAWCEGFTTLWLIHREFAEYRDNDGTWMEGYEGRLTELAVMRGKAIQKMSPVPPFLLKWTEQWNDRLRDTIQTIAEAAEPKVGRPRKVTP